MSTAKDDSVYVIATTTVTTFKQEVGVDFGALNKASVYAFVKSKKVLC
jgi:hypothetical protein